MNSLRPAAPWICARCRAKESTRFNRRPFASTSSERSLASEELVERPNLSPLGRKYERPDEKRLFPTSTQQVYQQHDRLPTRSGSLREFLASQAQRNSSSLYSQQRGSEALRLALRQNNAKALSSILASAQLNDEENLLQRLPLATWTQILKLLTSSALKPPFHRIHRAHKPRELVKIGYSHEQEQYEAVQRMVRLATVRRDQGIGMGLLDYRLLLRCTASIADANSARRIWVEMKQDGVQPDLTCYNSFISALLWDENARLQQLRKAVDTKERERPLFAPIMTFRAQTVEDIRNIYNEMLERGINGDAMTCSLLLVASGRGGRHLDEASGILTHFWGIDMPSLARATAASPPTKELTPTSPLYPSTLVLSAIAEAFGSQNEIPLALRLIDYFNQHFGVPVKENIWHHLLFWMWTHTRAATGLTRKDLSRDSLREAHQRVFDFFHMKLKQTRKNEASVDELHMIFKLMIESDKWATDQLLQILEAGRMTYLDSARAWQGAVVSYRRIKKSVGFTQDAARLLRARRLVKRLELERNRKHQYLQRWAHLTVQRWASAQSREGLPHEMVHEINEWQQRTLPAFILRWKRFLSGKVKYRIATGDLELFVTRWEKQHQRAEAKRRKFLNVEANSLLIMRQGEYRMRDKRRTMRKSAGIPRKEAA